MVERIEQKKPPCHHKGRFVLASPERS
jgi:hypothetical protein